jgi:hypothetical protein
MPIHAGMNQTLSLSCQLQAHHQEKNSLAIALMVLAGQVSLVNQSIQESGIDPAGKDEQMPWFGQGFDYP